MLLPRLKLDAATRFELVSPKGLSLLQSAGYPILPRSDNKLVDLAILETANLLSANQMLFRLSYRPFKSFKSLIYINQVAKTSFPLST